MEWVWKNRPENTTRSYLTYQEKFLKLCKEEETPLSEATPEIVGMFLYKLAKEHKARASIGVAQAAIADLFRFSAKPPTGDPLVKAVAKTAKSLAPGPRGKWPVTKELLLQMGIRAAKDTSEVKTVRDYLMVLLMFVAFLRESEVVELNRQDVWIQDVNGENLLLLLIRRSKTDQQGDGETIVVAKAKEPILCPITWFNLYQTMVTVRQWAPEKFFFALDKKNLGRPLSHSTPNHIVKKMLREGGMTEELLKNYGSHSCRRGGASAAFRAQMDEVVIKKHGRWKSDCVYLYCEPDLKESALLSQKITDLELPDTLAVRALK